MSVIIDIIYLLLLSSSSTENLSFSQNIIKTKL